MKTRPWLTAAGAEPRRHAPATARNRDAIAAVLETILPPRGVVLEVASGSGEHAVAFAARFPALDWQPSDADPDALASIAAWRAEAGLPNLCAPIALDAAAAWPTITAAAVLCINMVHISPWRATEGLMRGAAAILPAGAPLYLYGPFIRAGVDTAPSNRAFDASLRAQNTEWGLRDLDAVTALADSQGMVLDRVVEMPANNLSIVFNRPE